MQNKERRVALVTGASQGLGAAIALRLARDGLDVAVTELDKAALGETLAGIAATGRRAHSITLDLRSDASILDAIDQAVKAFGAIDVLVNNAAVTLRRDAMEVTPDDWDAVLDVNLKGTFFMCQQMAKHLVGRGRPGRIINLASTHGVTALAKRSTYGISKGALIHMTRVLAFEWASHGISVNAVAPGTIETPSRAAYFAENPGTRAAMLARVPAGRFATAEELAGAVSYLSGPDAAFVTGQTLLLDGGLTTY